MKRYCKLIGVVFTLILINTAFASEPMPKPKVLLPGSDQQIPLTEQITHTLPITKQKPPPSYIPDASNYYQSGFDQSISDYNLEINKFFKKMTASINSIPQDQAAMLYVLFKNAQQTNLLLKEQNKMLGAINTLNKNIEVIIQQNNSIIKILAAQKKPQPTANNSAVFSQ